MPANTLEKKISIDSFFQNLDEISGELDRVDKKTDQALQEVKSSSIKAFSNENYFESLLKSLTEQEEIVQKVSSENQQQNTTINNLTNVVNQEGDTVKQTIVNQNQITNQISEVGDRVKSLEKSGEKVVNQNQITNQISEVGDTVKQTIVNQNQITNQISEVGDRVKSLEKSGEKVVDQILNLKKENNTENQQLSKAFQVLKQSYDSLSSGVQSVRTDVEGISEYLLKDQQQRRNLLEQRKLKKARETDVKEKSDIMSALKKALGGTKDQEMFGNIMSQQDYAAIKNPPGGGASGSGGSGGGGLGGGALAAAGVGVAAGALGTMMGGDSASPGSSGSGGDVGPWGPLLKVIAAGESGRGGYESMYPSTTLPGATKMTIADVARKATGAVGKYQQLPQYLVARAKNAGLNPDKDLYSPANQDVIAAKVNIGMNRGGNDWLAGKFPTEKFGRELSKEFAALKQPNGVGYHDGDGRNKATVEWKTVEGALNQVKKGGGSPSTTAAAGTPQAASGAGTPQAAAGSPQAPAAGSPQAPAGSPQASGAGSPQAPAGSPQAPAAGAAPSYLPDPSKSLGANLRDLTSSAQPQMKQMDPSSIVPFDTQQVASGGYSQAPRNQGQQSNITSTPDFPEAIPTSNPLTKMWTLSAINHLNINGSMDHIYG